MKKSVYIFGFLALLNFSTALMFEILQWPFSAIPIIIGFVLFNFGFLPTFFLKLYKTEKIKLID